MEPGARGESITRVLGTAECALPAGAAAKAAPEVTARGIALLAMGLPQSMQ